MKRNIQKKIIKVGIQIMIKHSKFLIGIIFVFLFFKLITVEKKINRSDYAFLNAHFNKVDGLQDGAEIRLSGVKIGVVDNMFLENNKPTLKLAIMNSINIPTDSSISIQTDGLFGKKYLTIEPGGSDSYIKNGENLLFTEDSILIQDLLEKIIKIGELKKGN